MDRQLFQLSIKQIGVFWCEQWWIIKTSYRHGRFLFAWLWLRMNYLLDSPYWVSRRYQRQHDADDVHVYGETPLPALARIVEKAGVAAGDQIFELGSGSGFTSLWLNAVKGCKVVAVEQIPLFCWRLKRTVRRAGLSGIDVRCEDYLQTSLAGADFIYLYGSNLEGSVIHKLSERLLELPDQVKVITVSYPLSDYVDGELFPLIDRFTVDFEWGCAEVFVQSIR